MKSFLLSVTVISLILFEQVLARESKPIIRSAEHLSELLERYVDKMDIKIGERLKGISIKLKELLIAIFVCREISYVITLEAIFWLMSMQECVYFTILEVL